MKQDTLWPGGARSALIATPVLLAVLVLAFLGIRSAADWPSRQHDGTVLIVILIIGLLPFILLVVGRLTEGGSVELFGVRLNFAAARTESDIAVTPQLGLAAGQTINETSVHQIIDSLRSASRSKVAVVELTGGPVWWETRLLILCAGAARLGSPEAIVFVSEHGLHGWASPGRLLAQLLRDRTDLAMAYERAQARLRQWELTVPDPPVIATPPLSPADDDPWRRSAVFPPELNGRRNPYAGEQLLGLELRQVEQNNRHGTLTPGHVDDLFGHILNTTHFDIEDPRASFAEAVLSTTAPFLALTHGRRYAALMAREQAVNEVLRTLLRSKS